MSRQLRVTFEPHERAVFVLVEGTRLLEAAGRAEMTIETPCGGASPRLFNTGRIMRPALCRLLALS